MSVPPRGARDRERDHDRERERDRSAGGAPYYDEATPLLSGQDAALFCETQVYPLIHEIRVDMVAHIDTPLTYDQLVAPDSTYTIIRPLTDKYLEMRNHSVVFCLLLNKVQFVRDSAQLSIATLSLSRATLCEILAIRVLRGWSERSLHLATVLLTPWPMFQGASNDVVERAKEDGDDDLLLEGGTALEMAIISSSKRFIRSPSCQKVIEGIWSGRIIYSASNAHAFIADNYKKRPIQMYNPHKAPILDHYRLKVPKIRSFLEYVNFLVLFILYVVAIEGLETYHLNKRELAFIVYALAFSLDKAAAMREHGLKVFSSSLVNGFDLVFIMIYVVYLGARVWGFHYANNGALELGADLLAMGAVLMFPRLAFMTLANNLMILSIRSMLVEFFFLMAVGVFCFLGFVYALRTLGQGRYPISQIGWWLLEVYFGLDASGFEAAHDFNPVLGPCLMITYALLSNTLLLTVLVAILGNTFATINADAAAESMFRKAVATIEGVKGDSVFSYQLPFNVVAVLFLYPLSFVLNPRWFHKVNVFMIRATNLPVLMLIALYERQRYHQSPLLERVSEIAERYVGSLPRRITAAAGFEGIVGSRKNISVIFEIEREVGNFYRGWDDDGIDDDELPTVCDDGDDESDTEAAAPGEPGKAEPHTPRTPHSEGGQQQQQQQQQPERVYTSSPSQASFDLSHPSSPAPRRRRSSMPHAPEPSPDLPPIFPAAPLARARRNSSIHGPSPLAQLFVRSDDSNHQHVVPIRRPTMLAGSLPASSSLPALANSPRRHRFSMATPNGVSNANGGNGAWPAGSVGDTTRPHKSIFSRPSVAPIREASPAGIRPDDESGLDRPDRSGDGGGGDSERRIGQDRVVVGPVPFPRSPGRVTFEGGRGRGTSATTHAHTPHEAATASEVLAHEEAEGAAAAGHESMSGGGSDVGGSGGGGVDRSVTERLEVMDARQRRIEALLERLVASGQAGAGESGVTTSTRQHDMFDLDQE